MNRQRLLQRFLRYVQIDSTAGPDATTYPSSPGQLDFGRLLVEELHAIGIADARQDEHGIVLATVPGGGALAQPVARGSPTIALCSHLDTSPETSGAGIKPQVIENYCRRRHPAARRPQSHHPRRRQRRAGSLRGRTIITSDGTTLLGADDKAGVAIIMETAAWLVEHPKIPHGPIRICFTCDEEIGHGVDHLKLDEIGATVCYTLDGHASGEIDVETFSADQAVVTVEGVNIHPSIAKGRMTNAVPGGRRFHCPVAARPPLARNDRRPRGLPAPLRHRRRRGRGEGQDPAPRFRRRLAGPGRATPPNLRGRDGRVSRRQNLRGYRAAISEYGRGARGEPRAVAYADEALRRLGRTGKRTIVRGGTDGSRLTEMGLPTPNLSCGDHNPHSPLEWACLDEMVESVEWLVSLAEVWGEDRG